jgi:hypothetical protein
VTYDVAKADVAVPLAMAQRSDDLTKVNASILCVNCVIDCVSIFIFKTVSDEKVLSFCTFHVTQIKRCFY